MQPDAASLDETCDPAEIDRFVADFAGVADQFEWQGSRGRAKSAPAIADNYFCPITALCYARRSEYWPITGYLVAWSSLYPQSRYSRAAGLIARAVDGMD